MKMRYSLRTLLIVMFLVGPLCVFVWPKYLAWREAQARLESERVLERERAAAQLNMALLTKANTAYDGGNRPITMKSIKPGTPISSYNEETGEYEKLSELDPRYIEIVRRGAAAAEQNESTDD